MLDLRQGVVGVDPVGREAKGVEAKVASDHVLLEHLVLVARDGGDLGGAREEVRLSRPLVLELERGQVVLICVLGGEVRRERCHLDERAQDYDLRKAQPWYRGERGERIHLRELGSEFESRETRRVLY